MPYNSRLGTGFYYLYAITKKMKNLKGFVLILMMMTTALFSFGQKIISEGTIVYDVVIKTGDKEPQKGDALQGATSTIYLKANNSRTDLVSPLGKEVIIYNSKTNNARILKEFSGQKLMIELTKDDWKAKNRMYSDIKFELTSETTSIAGYNVRKAIASMPDGKSFIVYYAPDLVVANKSYDATFTNLPGLPIQYEIESGKMKFRYTLSKISYDPVLVSQFDFPTSGYRVMTYEENQKMKKGNK
jgi:GLPGLI family protein